MSAADSDGNNRRNDDRQPVVLRVDYDGADDFLCDYTENLSRGGTFIATPRELPIGTEIRLVLSFPGLVAPIHVTGVVRWTRGADQPGIGIEFMGDEAGAELDNVITRIRAGDRETVQRLLRVLVVEDNPHVAELIQAGLQGSSKRLGDDVAFNFRTASNGKEALSLLESERFDAAIVDVYLPILDGAQVIFAARRDLGLTELPIIAVSAGGDSARRQAVQAGADMFIDKPMRLRQVIETMQLLIRPPN